MNLAEVLFLRLSCHATIDSEDILLRTWRPTFQFCNTAFIVLQPLRSIVKGLLSKEYNVVAPRIRDEVSAPLLCVPIWWKWLAKD